MNSFANINDIKWTKDIKILFKNAKSYDNLLYFIDFKLY